MNKLVLAIALAATVAAIVPADAATRKHLNNANAALQNSNETTRMVSTSPGATIRVGDACWKQTDAGRGYGFWTACDNTVSYARAASEYTQTEGYSGGTEGGGGNP